MNKILSKLNSVPGVAGSMICNEQGQVLAQLFPPNVDANALKSIASLITDNVPAFQECTGGVKMFNFKFETGRVIVRQDHNRYFVLLCSNTVSVNLQILDMIIDVASKQLEKGFSQTAEKAVASTSAPVSTVAKHNPSEVIEKGPLSASLSGMQTALIKFLGPMAKIIFTECVEKWLESNAPSREALPELVTIINQEINDNIKSAQYMQNVSPYM